MDLNQAIENIKKAVKYTGTIDQKHIDLTIVSVDERPNLEKALMIAQTAIKEGQITREVFLKQTGLD